MFEFAERNLCLTIRDELAKFSQAYSLEDEKATSIVANSYGFPIL